MKRRRFLHAGVGLSCALAGCLNSINPSSSSSNGLPCPSSIPIAENADFEGEFKLQCNTDTESAAAAEDSIIVPSTRSASLDAETQFTLTNHREQVFNANFYNWHLQKYVEGEWHDTVGRRFSANAGGSLAPDESHSWSLSVRNDNLDQPVEPVRSDENLTVRALGPGTYAFLIVGSYGHRGQSWLANQPVIGYAAPFTLEGDQLELVPTDRVQQVDREGDTVVVTVGTDDPTSSVTVTKNTGTQTTTRDQQSEYITESVYGNPLLRDILAHFEPDVTCVTVRTTGVLGTQFHRGASFTYDNTTYEITAVNR